MENFLEWLAQTPLFRWAHRRGGIKSFKLAHEDILLTMQDDLDDQAEELAQQKLSQMLTAVDMTKVISQKGKILYLGKNIIDEGTLANLKSEAEFLYASQIWKVIQETPRELAQLSMFVDDGKIENQLIKGRAVLYTLDTQKRIVELLSSLYTVKE